MLELVVMATNSTVLAASSGVGRGHVVRWQHREQMRSPRQVVQLVQAIIFASQLFFVLFVSLYWVGTLSLYLHNAMQFIDVVTSWGTLPAPLGRSALDPQ